MDFWASVACNNSQIYKASHHNIEICLVVQPKAAWQCGSFM